MEENQPQELNPFLTKILEKMKERQNQSTGSITTVERPQSSTLVQCGLDNYDCEICSNMGFILFRDNDGYDRAASCSCMKKRISIRRINGSGLNDMVKRYTFDNYQTPTRKHEIIKQKAQEFVKAPAECFVIVGRSGSGKTHICTAICNSLMQDDWNLKYMMWRTEAAELKAMITEREEYKRRINQLKNVPVLYIDDFFKGTVTDGDINLAFTILNDRYNSSGKKTIISTELSIEDIVSKDEAIGGRIAERARGYTFYAPNENWRTRP